MLYANIIITKPVDPEKCHVTENMIPLPQDNIKAGLQCTRSNELHEKKNQYIVGGSKTEKGRYPWQVRLQIDCNNGVCGVCGGSILSENWVITAAHCCEGSSNIKIHVGDWNQNVDSDDEFSVFATEIIIHPGRVPTSINTITFLC